MTLDPQIFIDAADYLEVHWRAWFAPRWYPEVGCCSAIRRGSGYMGGYAFPDSREQACELFEEWFYPGIGNRDFGKPYAAAGFWWGPTEREPRLLALCLAAAILEDEQTPEPKPKGKSLRRAAASASLRVASRAGTRRRRNKRGTTVSTP